MQHFFNKRICALCFFLAFSTTQLIAQQWTWVGGDSTTNINGVYGTQGTAAAANKPGARSQGVTWSDASGNLWLMGGNGYAAS